MSLGYWFILSFFFFACTPVFADFFSVDNCGCGAFGTCEDNACVCAAMWEGVHCEVSWRYSKPSFHSWWVAHQALELVLTFGVLFVIFYQLYVTLRYARAAKWQVKSMPTSVLLLLGTGVVLRIVSYIYDPFSERGLLDVPTSNTLYILPVIFWLACVFGITFYWVELQSARGLQHVTNVKRLRPLLLACTIGTTVLLLPLTIGSAITGDMVANLLYYLAVIVCILVAAITCLIFGVRLLRLLGTYQSTKQLDSAAAKFLQRLTWFLFSLIADMIILALLTALYATGLVNTEPVPLVIMQVLTNMFEWFGMLIVLRFIWKTPPKVSRTPSQGSTAGTTGTAP